MYAGIILHDVGKVIELSGPIATQYTIEGNLLGHITIMVNEISKAADELEITGEEVMLLATYGIISPRQGRMGKPETSDAERSGNSSLHR